MHPASRPAGLVLLLLLLIPSAAYLWQNHDLPEFCMFHDDCVYFVSAKSLAEGTGYRISSLPGAPAQTKFPPLYPLLLSLAWHIDPVFPHNLPLAVWLSWLAIPAALLALAAYSPHLGLTHGRAWVAVSLFALNAYTIWLGSQLLSEPLFLAMLLATLLWIERRRAATAGVLAGFAYLTRSAGIALLPVGFYCLWKASGKRAAFRFLAASLPFVIGWTLWSHVHKLVTNDPALYYYTDYRNYALSNVDWSNLHVVAWKNADGLLWGLGSLVLPKFIPNHFLKILTEVLAVAMISGIIRMVRKGYGHSYVMFAVAQIAVLIVWRYPPDERLVYPLFPLALAGLLYEGEHIATMLRTGLRSPQTGQRVTAGIMIGLGALLAAAALAVQFYMSTALRSENARQHRLLKTNETAAAGWIRANLPEDATVLANADPLLYLDTGRRGLRRTLMTRLWYAEDNEGLVNLWGDLGGFARRSHLD